MALGMENIRKFCLVNFLRHPALIVLLRTFRKCIFFLSKRLPQRNSSLACRLETDTVSSVWSMAIVVTLPDLMFHKTGCCLAYGNC